MRDLARRLRDRYPGATPCQRVAKLVEEAAELSKAINTEADPVGYGHRHDYTPRPLQELADVGVVWLALCAEFSVDPVALVRERAKVRARRRTHDRVAP